MAAKKAEKPLRLLQKKRGRPKKGTPRIPKNAKVIQPQKGGQWEYFTRSEFEVLFGGAAGPGKSWALVIDALGLQFRSTPVQKAAVEIPDYRAVIFRRKTTQLSKLIDEAKKYYCSSPFHATYTAHRRGDPGPSFTFPSGARIFFCHMELEEDKESHQGIEYQFVGFDELTQFTLTQYLYLFSRARSTIPGLFPRIRATTNPTGAGLLWVKKRFIRNGDIVLEPKKTYYFAPDRSVSDPYVNPMGIMVNRDHPDARSRTFVPGFLHENRILMENDPTYVQNIRAMGAKYERALLHGDWDAFSGDFFDDFSNQLCVRPFIIPEDWSLIGSLDPGWSSPCSFGLSARDFEGNIYRLFTYYVRDASPDQHARAIREMIENFPYTRGRMPDYIVAGHDAFERNSPSAIHSNEYTFERVFRNILGLSLRKARTERVLGWWAWKQLMRQRKWKYFDGFNDPLIEEIVAAQHDEKVPEDIEGRGNDPNVYDHALDETRYSVLALFEPEKHVPRQPREDDDYALENWREEVFELERPVGADGV